MARRVDADGLATDAVERYPLPRVQHMRSTADPDPVEDRALLDDRASGVARSIDPDDRVSVPEPLLRGARRSSVRAELAAGGGGDYERNHSRHLTVCQPRDLTRCARRTGGLRRSDAA